MKTYDFVVLGGGSAGYAAASTAAGLGLETAVVDGSERLGGLCILRGCMPSKAVIESANRSLTVRRAAEFGIEVEGWRVDAGRILERKRALVEEFASYRAGQLEGGRFALIRGLAAFADSHTLSVSPLEGGGEPYEIGFRTALIATGSVISCPPVPGLADSGYITSDDALELDAIPESVVILGGGAIALEAAHHLEGLGSEVTLVQRSPHLLNEIDHDLADALQAAMQKDRRIRIFTGTHITGIERRAGGSRRVTFEHGGETCHVEAPTLMSALGRNANTGTLDLRSAGVDTAGLTVVASSDQRTSQQHIFAAGDVCGPYEIVHIAIEQGEVAATNAAIQLGKLPEDRRREMDYRLKLMGIFSHPEVATVGIGEHEAEALGREIVTASYPFDDHGKSMVMGETEGFVKLIADARTKEILGAGVVGPEAVTLIHEIAVAMYFRAKAGDLLAIPHYHPTLSEIWTYPAEEIEEA
ncbi:dihydrolipoyl dehydrogenase [soil metagenome]